MTSIEKEKLVYANRKIPTQEIEKDIFDTEEEIKLLREETAVLIILGDKVSMVRAQRRIHKVTERQEFIEKLNIILEERKKNA